MRWLSQAHLVDKGRVTPYTQASQLQSSYPLPQIPLGSRAEEGPVYCQHWKAQPVDFQGRIPGWVWAGKGLDRHWGEGAGR